MNILSAIFPKAKKITSEAIAVEIDRAEADLVATHDKLAHVFDGLAVMSEEQHAEAEDKATALRRYGERLQARIDALRAEHEIAVAAEAETAKIAAEAARQKRVEAADNAVEVEAADLLRSYDADAARIAATLARLAEIDAEARECGVSSVDHIHRKHRDQQASERREKRPHWVYTVRHAEERGDGRFGGAKWGYHDEEVVIRATLDDNGRPLPLGASPVASNLSQTVTTPRIEMREVAVERRQYRPGRTENPLSGIHLPPGFAGGVQHWPRPRS